MPKIRVNSAEFYYEIQGTGSPVILISGYTCDHLNWAPILDKLSQRFKVLVFDNRAIGQTTDQGEPLSVEMMADDVIALAQALDLKKPCIVGHSMGGTIAQNIASRYGDQIRKLVLMHSSSKWRLAMLHGIESMLKMRQQGVEFEVIFQATLAWVFGEAFLQDAGNVQTLRKLILENPYSQSMEDQERQFAVLKQFDGRKQLKSIKVPTLVIQGSQDLLALPYEAEFLAAQITNAKLAICNCAHVCIAELPEKTIDLLKEFLA
ncbi:MAG: alpha/beta fold hydrolase [Simkania sp.]|nr:alpha/beta fold hydrolase [Simkania sp.]